MASLLFLSPYVDNNGNALSGGRIWTYAAGTTTPKATYTTSAATIANANPVILDSSGFAQIWLTGAYKIEVRDSNNVLLRTLDNVNDYPAGSSSSTEWVASTLTPTFISSTSFSVLGNQTADLQVGRRIRISDSSTLYGTITASVFTTLTTVTVQLDSGAITGAITAFALGFASVTNPSLGVAAVSGLNISQSFQVGGTVAANALTATLQPTPITFRSATAGSGSITNLMVSTALSLTVPSGATLGAVNAIASRIVVLAINNAGTVELAVVNLAGGVDLSETGTINTTAISAGATSATTIYSQTARTGVPYRVVGFIESTQATAGTWATAPSLVQGVGGQAFVAMNTLGYGQTWQSVTGSRALSTTYYNTTGRPIQVFMSAQSNLGGGGSATMAATVNGVALPSVQIEYYWSNVTVTFRNSLSFIVPPGQSYSVTPSVASTLIAWAELR